MEEESVTDYAIPVHKSLMEKHLLFGVGQTVFYAILIITVILVCLVSPYCAIIGVIAFFICRLLCKKEPQLMEFIFQNLFIQDIYRG